MKGKASGSIIDERSKFILVNAKSESSAIQCESDSIAGSISQRACVYCGARVVLNPITDAYHIVHGPIGCASYTWDIRGSLSSGPEIYRNSFSTDIKEHEVIFGGEQKLQRAIDEIMEKNTTPPPKVIFVYATCIVGVIGDDIEAVCRRAEEKYGIRVIPVKSAGFAGRKSDGYKAACHALLDLMGSKMQEKKNTINFLGDFNLAAEAWIVRSYLAKIGVRITSTLTGDSRCHEIKKAPQASLNIVQCAGSMTYLAKQMEKQYGIPFMQVSFFGLEDIRNSMINVAKRMGNEETLRKAIAFIKEKESEAEEILNKYRSRLAGKKAAIYVGGGFKAISLIKQFRSLGMKVTIVGTQTGKPEEYRKIRELTEEGTIILDDSNPYELENFIIKTGSDILVGGVKERPLAYKLGLAFCDHNHERKHPLAGYEGAVNFAAEVDASINSPVWDIVKDTPALFDI